MQLVNISASNQADRLKVLVVDDSNTNRQLLAAMLNKMGYRPFLAVDGRDALAQCELCLPDLVLMDVAMPDMSGFDVVRLMRRRFDSWVPIIFVSANAGNQDVLEGLRAGGDDYLFKPVNYEILQAKIQIFQDRLEQNQRLLDYRERIEDETDTAREFIKQLTALDKINDPLVRFFLKPAENFSGDLIAVARKPDDCLHVLLADSAGHGLTAALAVIPITQPFYQMTAKGFDIPAIVREINKRVREYLPLPRFVAAALISFNPKTGIIQVWNGGCPPVLLLSPEGEDVVHRFTSRQLPLGVVGADEFDAGLEYYKLSEHPGHLLLCSDGATELRMGDNLALEHSGLLAGAKSSYAENLFDRIIDVIEDELDDLPPADDIAMIMVDCALPVKEERQESKSVVSQIDMEGAGSKECGVVVWEFSLTLTAQQLKRLDVVPFLLNVTGQIEGGRADGKLFLVLSELFNNALDHGVLKLDSRMKNQQEGMELYFETRAQRLAELTQGQIAMHLEKLGSAPGSCLKISIKDSGDGFEFADHRISDVSDSEQRHGRGIALLDSMCKSLQYYAHGTEVVAYVEIG
jgi:CheY-like chemotaxis protein